MEPGTKVEPKMVNLTINGKAVQAPAGTTVIKAAEDIGIFIPRYCYHSELSIAGVCRMCMVEVEKNPKLQISCNTTVQEGMVVRTDTPRVKDTVKSILEFHLINHPLDCPICDKSGECKLQDFYIDYGLYKSRMELSEKVHKPKVQDIGTIVLDSERCILCSRCVRFTAEITKTFELGIFTRGDRSELRTYDHGPLKNDYTGNLADICPVGALTAKDFRFKQRVWFLDKTPSICTFCAKGCNTVVSRNSSTKKMYRIEPRRNMEVNSSWICDKGRWGYHHVDDQTRIKNPRTKIENSWRDATWQDAFKALHSDLAINKKRMLVAISTQTTNEEILDAVLTLKTLGDVQFTWLVDESVASEKTPYDGLLRHHDQTPNAFGFQTMMKLSNNSWLKQEEALRLFKNGNFDLFLAIGLEGNDLSCASKFFLAISENKKEVPIFVHATNDNKIFETATWLLPNTSSFEKSGTMLNAMGRLQKLNATLPPQFTSRTVHELVLGMERGHDHGPSSQSRASLIYETHISKCLDKKHSQFQRLDPLGVQLKEV